MLAGCAAAPTRTSGNIASSVEPHVDAPIDLNGNLASDGLTSYTWNARNELIGLGGDISAGFQYDGLGRRQSKSSGPAISFLYDRSNVVQELSGDLPTANLLTGGMDEVFQRTESAGNTVLLADALGSTIALADFTGVIRTEYIYAPFGATSSSGSGNLNRVQYTGRENDTTGLYYYRARYYSVESGRFASEDPLGDADGWSPYVYADDDPINNSDPSGLFTTTRQRGSGNTVVCNGNGGLQIQLPGITSPCLLDCARRHELSHVIDIRSRNPSICMGQSRGTGIAPSDDAERKWTEIRASTEEINCLKRKLKENCDAKCKAIIETRIKQMEQYRDSFK